jgi:hypothetical protein
MRSRSKWKSESAYDAALTRFFKVPRSTAQGWLDWFQSLLARRV